MLHFRTEGYNGSAVKYSPFFDNRLAVSTSANFGLVGNGRLYILELTPNGIVPMKWYVRMTPRNPAIGILIVVGRQVHNTRCAIRSSLV